MSTATRPHPFAALLLGVCLSLAGAPASSQWIWTDAAGKKVFSDTAPPASVPDKQILRRPSGRSAPVAEPLADTSAAAPTAGAAPASPKPPAVDPELQARRKKAEEAEAAKAKAEEERLAKARADNCERARRAKATLDSGVRLATTNAKGEREVMDDAARAAEAKRLDSVIASDCGPLPRSASAQ